jgi:hypothetical protein
LLVFEEVVEYHQMAMVFRYHLEVVVVGALAAELKEAAELHHLPPAAAAAVHPHLLALV